MLTSTLGGAAALDSDRRPAPSGAELDRAVISDIDHKVCTAVTERDGELACANEQYTLSTDESTVYSFLKLHDVESDRSIRWEWYTPSGEFHEVVRTTVEAPPSEPNTVTTAASINVARGPPSDEPGEWTVKIFIGDGIILSYRFNITDPPVPEFESPPATPSVNDTVVFDASGSTDPDGTIAAYRWDFDGDGAPDATGEVVEHRFEQGGTREVALTVVDEFGLEATLSRAIHVNHLPDGSFEVHPDPPRTNSNTTFVPSNVSDRDGRVVGFEWDLDGDGGVDATGTTVRHEFERPGDYSISLRLIDDDNASTVISRNVTVFRDSDGDGLLDRNESELGTDPREADTDGDGLEDGREVEAGADPLEADTDGDGLGDAEEVREYGTDPREADTDGDGLSDAEEVREHGTDPREADTDGDGLDDRFETIFDGLDPLSRDSDGDGLEDGREVEVGADPLEADTDGDGLGDAEEVREHGTDPQEADTDGDGLDDAEEVREYGTDPREADSDGDGLTDPEEVRKAREAIEEFAANVRTAEEDGLVVDEEKATLRRARDLYDRGNYDAVFRTVSEGQDQLEGTRREARRAREAIDAAERMEERQKGVHAVADSLDDDSLLEQANEQYRAGNYAAARRSATAARRSARLAILLVDGVIVGAVAFWLILYRSGWVSLSTVRGFL